MARIQVRRAPRIILVSDASPRSRQARIEPGGPSRVGWRVIAANNRPLGRSATVFASEGACLKAVAILQERIDDTVSSVLFDATRGHWTWSLQLDEEPVAVCVHPYLRRIECSRALTQFVAAMKVGEPAEERVRNLGVRALHAYDRAVTRGPQ